MPQPETLLSVGQIDPAGFKGFIKHGKAILICRKGKEEQICTNLKNVFEKLVRLFCVCMVLWNVDFHIHSLNLLSITTKTQSP